MPKFYHKNLPKKGELGLWRIEEPEAFFSNNLTLYPIEQMQLAEIKGRMRLEWLASRWLLHSMSQRKIRGACLKDEYGKPHLTASNFEISISHSWNMVAIMAAPYSIGIDIQKEVSKITRIEHKFIRPIEKDSFQEASKLEHLHIYWGAKEALYKAYGRKKLGFIEHIHINPFEYNLAIGKTIGAIHKGDYHAYYDIFYEKVAEFFMVYALERDKG